MMLTFLFSQALAQEDKFSSGGSTDSDEAYAKVPKFIYVSFDTNIPLTRNFAYAYNYLHRCLNSN